MSDEEKEKVLDLLYDKFVYGLNEEEARELDSLGYDAGEAESIEKTIAVLGLVGLEAEAAMPASLQAKLRKAADENFGSAAGVMPAAVEPERQIVLSGPRPSWFGWLGWAAAATASIILAVVLFSPKPPDRANVATPTPVVEEKLDPAQKRQRLIDSAQAGMVRAEWGKGNVKELESVSGDVVWSDEKQEGYMLLRGLAKNDVSKQTYQLWIFDETQSDKTPIDGGTFDVNSDGEVVIPIDAKLKAKNPAAFAITIEKPGGVVVSSREKVAALAPVKPAKA